MKLRKNILLACIMFFVVMLVNGILALSYYGREGRGGKIDTQDYTQLSKPHLESSMVKNSPVNMLLLGLDEEGVRTDVILLINYDPENSRLNLLSIARDTKVYARGKYSKINAVYSAGKENMVAEEVKQLTGLNVNYFMTMNFKGFRKLVDTLDGVIFKVPFDMDYDDPVQNLHIHLNKGLQKLDGNKAEQLVRYRKGNRHDEGYVDGDIGRINMQQDFIKAMIKQKISLKYFTKIDDIFAIFLKYFRTNIELSDFTYYLPNIRNIKFDDINSFTIPGESVVERDAWYYIADKKKTLEMIENSFYK